MSSSHFTVPNSIRVISSIKNNKVSVTSSASWLPISTQIITPTSSSSKFILLGTIEYEGGTTVDGLGLFRDGSILAAPNTPGSRIPMHFFGEKKSHSFSYIDSPATASTITYELKRYLFGGSSTTHGAAVTQFIILEV